MPLIWLGTQADSSATPSIPVKSKLVKRQSVPYMNLVPEKQFTLATWFVTNFARLGPNTGTKIGASEINWLPFERNLLQDILITIAVSKTNHSLFSDFSEIKSPKWQPHYSA